MKRHHYNLLILLSFLPILVFACATPAAETTAPPVTLEGRSITDSLHLPLLDSATLGDPDAPIVIVEFVGLPCDDCARGARAVDALYEQMEGQVQVVFKHRPNDERQESWMAARMLEAAHRQGEFWGMRALLLERNEELKSYDTREFAMGLAEELGLDARRFRVDLESMEIVARIERDQRLAEELELRINPTYFVNGLEMVGPQRLSVLEEAVEQVERMSWGMQAESLGESEHYRRGVMAFLEEREEARHTPDVELAVQEVDRSSAFVEVEAGDIVYGEKEDFLVTLVEFSSLQCLFSADASKTVERLNEYYEGEVRFVFKHFPMDMHIHSEDASRALIAADRQGAGPQMMRHLFGSQDLFAEDGYFQGAASDLELDATRFTRDFSAAETEEAIWQHREEGEELGVVGTPQFFINGVRVSGAMPFEYFQEIIDREILRAREVQERQALEGDDLYRALVEESDEQ